MIQILNDNWEIDIDPDAGSIFRKCRYKTLPIFRDYEPGAANPQFPQFSAGNFPLLPFSNRIENGRFHFDDAEIRLTQNAPGQKHPLHGFGWISKWQTTQHQASGCTLRYTYREGEWPWAYSAVQTIKAEYNTLIHSISITNDSDRRMPAGLGFHPYFPKLATSRLAFPSRGVWLPDEDYLPDVWQDRPDAFDFSTSQILNNYHLDHCFTQVGDAEISWSDMPISLHMETSENLRWAAVFTDKANDCFCFEPVSHAHNAVNMTRPEANGVKILEPNETLSAQMAINVSMNL